MVDFDKSDKTIKIMGKVNKPNTDNRFNIFFLIGNRTSSEFWWSSISNNEKNIESIVSVWFIQFSTYFYHIYIYIYIYIITRNSEVKDSCFQ